MPPGSNNLDGGRVAAESFLKLRMLSERQQIDDERYLQCVAGRICGEAAASGRRLLLPGRVYSR